MEDKELKIAVSKRLAQIRASILLKSPFYGALVMRLNIKLAKCNTAATDMSNIYFDPEFVNRLSDEEVEFVFMHEVMHCVLQHCVRRGGRNHYFYNIASDIVVNSNIMQSMGVATFMLDGEEPMHKAPNGKEGYLYNAEEIYDMLMDKYGKLVSDVNDVAMEIATKLGVTFDDHEIWEIIPLDTSLPDEWKKILIDAATKAADDSMSSGIRSMVEELERSSRLNWREILHDFIQLINDTHDYTFSPRDRRFDGDFIIPAFTEVETERVNNIWFVVDASGSVPDEKLTQVHSEICSAIDQFESLEGKISFFDSNISEPVDFNSAEDLKKLEIIGGGGTSFHIIFRELPRFFEKELPSCIVILTDGYACYPPETAALGVPVLWIIFNNDDMAPWGTSVRLE